MHLAVAFSNAVTLFFKKFKLRLKATGSCNENLISNTNEETK